MISVLKFFIENVSKFFLNFFIFTEAQVSGSTMDTLPDVNWRGYTFIFNNNSLMASKEYKSNTIKELEEKPNRSYERRIL